MNYFKELLKFKILFLLNFLIFYRETKTDSKGKGFSAKSWSIDLTGYNERQVPTPTDGSDPSWSSLLSN